MRICIPCIQNGALCMATPVPRMAGMKITLPRFAFALMALLSFGVAGYALVGYTVMPLGALVGGDMPATYRAHWFGILSHVFAASVALLLGPLQFWARLRQRAPHLHRWLGRLYLGIGVGLGGLSGLYMAHVAAGGPVARIGFALLALAWLYTGAQALAAIRRGQVARHRDWMLRNFALTLGAVTLRIQLPAALAIGLPFEMVYPAIAWLAWVPNLVLAEWLLRRRRPAMPASGGRSDAAVVGPARPAHAAAARNARARLSGPA